MHNAKDTCPADRLRAAPGVQRVPNPALDLFIVRRFLPPELCLELIARIDDRRRPSDLADDNGVANFRTSETCDLDAGDPVVIEVGSRICDLLGIPPEHGEQI